MLVVKQLSGPTRYLPYYFNMRVGQFVTQIAAPAMGCAVAENGDVYDRFVLKGSYVFTQANRDKYLSEVIEDVATLLYSICLGRIEPVFVGNTVDDTVLVPRARKEEQPAANDEWDMCD